MPGSRPQRRPASMPFAASELSAQTVQLAASGRCRWRARGCRWPRSRLRGRGPGRPSSISAWALPFPARRGGTRSRDAAASRARASADQARWCGRPAWTLRRASSAMGISAEEAAAGLDDPRRGLSVAVGIHRSCHLGVGVRRIRRANVTPRRRSSSSSVPTSLTVPAVTASGRSVTSARHQHRLAQSGGLLLHAARVGQHQAAAVEQAHEGQVGQGLDQVDVAAARPAAGGPGSCTWGFRWTG